MWETICGWFSAFFAYIRPQRADFEAVVKTQTEIITHQATVLKSMEGRIEVMDREFRVAMERRDGELVRAMARIEKLEQAEEDCRKRLSRALTSQAELATKIKVLLAEKEEGERIKALKDDQQYQRDTIAHVETLLEHRSKGTKVDQ